MNLNKTIKLATKVWRIAKLFVCSTYLRSKVWISMYMYGNVYSVGRRWFVGVFEYILLLMFFH